MKSKLLLIILLLYASSSFAQGEAKIWYFGDRAGLDFNSGSPIALTDSQMITPEGCAVLSSSTGQMLFYTNGVTVWNRNHQVMLNGNGLLGNESSTQSCIIVPKPGSTNLFYIFTTDSEGKVNGFRYSLVDMMLDNGLGGVTIEKNVMIYTPTSEKLTVVKHANNLDYWIVTHGFFNNSFNCYQLKATGLDPIPVITNIGAITPRPFVGSGGDAAGVIKLSPNGTKLIACHYNQELAELFDFNTATGILSNQQVIRSNRGGIYGAEFSIDNKVLYIISNGLIVQYDLEASQIISSSFEINRNDYTSTPISLQLGPDNKIYVSLYGRNKIAVIDKPEVLGIGCDFKNTSVDLAGRICRSGLPTFVQSFFTESEILISNNCINQDTQFELKNDQIITSASWDFGDGITSTEINPTHIYANPGTYTVSVTASGATGTSTKIKDIVIYEVPTATQPSDILVCDTNNDGFCTFDLISQTTAILNGQDSNVYGVNYLVNNVVVTNPTAYTNAIAYQEEIITAEVYNKANSGCKSTTSFKIDVFDTPKPKISVSKLSLCDNISVGTDTDRKIVFDLSQRSAEILNGQSATQFLLSYYKDAALTQNISNPAAYVNTNAVEMIYVKMANKDNLNCFATTSFLVEVLALPTINSTLDLKQCDDDTDGFSVFNLEEVIAKITSNGVIENISFYKTLLDAQNNVNPILNPTTYSNQTVSIDRVFLRVSNANGCYRIAQLNLIVSTTQIPPSFTRTFTECDDVASGSNTDGIATFDFSSVDNEVRLIFPSSQLLDITYYRNLADALAEKNAITDISNYRNIGYPNTQNIYIRVDSRLNNDCLGLGSYITLNVETIPIVATISPFIHCDDDQDGFYAFDVSSLDAQIKNGKDVTVRYFDTNNNPFSSPLSNPFVTKSQAIKVSITNNTTTACSYDTTIQFIVDKLPQAFTVPATLTTVCDDEINPATQDGKYAFDTSTFQNTILRNQTGMLVKYFDANNNSLSSPLPNPFVTETQNIRVEVINSVNSNCIATTTIPFVVHPIPNILLEGDELVCSNLPTFTKVIDAGIQDESPVTDYGYNWFFNGNPIQGANSYSLTVNTEGIYIVEVSNSHGCLRTRTITVRASDIAVITNVEITELSGSDSITVSVSGSGDYVYALDDELDEYQSENTFTNVSAGIHTVYVKDLNGCGITPKEVAVMGIPNFFTPNQDGYNDAWNIKGANTSFNSKTLIYIFDRYGKLIKQISPTGSGWDGTFNGTPMPSADYWYSVKLENGKELKGHFSLKR